MNTKEYIESGIIESYVLGLASAEEAAEVMQMSAQYPEIKQAIEDAEASFEQLAFDNAVTPPAEVKDILLQKLNGEFATAPGKQTKSKIVTLPRKDGGTEVVELRSIPLKRWKFIAAAAVILFIISASINVFYYRDYATLKDRYTALLNDRNSLQANNNTYRTKLDEADQQIRLLLDPSVKTIKVPGTPGHENNAATVFWNQSSKDVYLFINHLPQATADKQYQLWAIVDGKPVSAGLIGECGTAVCKLGNITNPQAFAITLEKKGGSTTPTMPIVALGKI